MRTSIGIAAAAFAALGIGYALGARQSTALAAPIPLGGSTSHYIASGAEPRELVVWVLDGAKVVSATRYWAEEGGTVVGAPKAPK
jgi:hypothetical protein